jgi:hypothetical protein
MAHSVDVGAGMLSKDFLYNTLKYHIYRRNMPVEVLSKMVGRLIFMTFILHSAHFIGRDTLFPGAGDARLICAAGPFVGRTWRTSLSR